MSLLINGITKDGRSMVVKLNRDQSFLDKLQSFITSTGYATPNPDHYEREGVAYDETTYYLVHKVHYEGEEEYETPQDIEDIGDGRVVRYVAEDKELFIVFTYYHIILLFSCPEAQQPEIVNALLTFSAFAQKT